VSLLVSIHDVTPAWADQVARLWTLCAERGLSPALLVVPDWHGSWPLARHPEFVGWLLSRSAEGAEIMLHGERHDEAGLPRRTADAWRAWGRTAGEGEFLTLDRAAAAERIARGLTCLRGLGLDPVGFVPPAWLARPGTYRAAAEAGLRVSEDDGAIVLLPSGHRVASPVLRWSARTPGRAWSSAAVAEVRWLTQRRAPVARIALHPGDLQRPATARSVVRSLDRWLTVHRPIRYEALAHS
jgi:predicted deacetylase